MRRATEIIEEVASQTDRVILFHSASGKDSIALLDLLYPRFKEVICVFMYVVKDLEHINRYLAYAKSKYPRIRFMQTPHFAVSSYIRTGYMGCGQDPKQKLFNLGKIADIVRARTGIEWVCLGFKQSDSMNRRVMLRTFDKEAIDVKNKKFCPLSSYKNKNVLDYIAANDLIQPEQYGKCQSSGTNITDINYLLWLKTNYPQDLQKIISEYPMVERILFEYGYERA